MAQDSENKSATTPPDHDDDNLHFYSGGEVKELANTKVSPAILATYGIIIVACIFFVWYAGALKWISPYQPKEGGSASLANIAAYLAQRDAAAGNVSSIDLDRLPPPPGQDEAGAIKKGETIYQTYCFGCHGPNEDGNGPNASGLNPKPRNLRDAAFMQSMSLERINQSIHRGVPGTAMPHWEDTLNEEQIRDVIFYVWSLTEPKPEAPAADASTGAPAAAGASATAPAASPGATPQTSAAKSASSTTKAFAPGTTPPAAPGAPKTITGSASGGATVSP